MPASPAEASGAGAPDRGAPASTRTGTLGGFMSQPATAITTTTPIEIRSPKSDAHAHPPVPQDKNANWTSTPVSVAFAQVTAI